MGEPWPPGRPFRYAHTDGDHSGEIVYVNDAFTEMTGYEAEDMVVQTSGMMQGSD